MAQKYLSAGVFVTEIDLSSLAQGVAGIGAVVVGRTPKGPAMVPIVLGDLESFKSRFLVDGKMDPDMQLPYCSRNYLKNATTLTVVRVLGHDDGTSAVNGYVVGSIAGIVNARPSGSVLAVLHHTGSVENVSVVGVSGDANKFVVSLGPVTPTFAVTASFLTSSAEYIGKVLNTDPTLYSTYGHYLADVFSYSSGAVSASWGVVGVSGAQNSFQKNFTGGSTPYVKSQPVGGSDFNLFKFHTIPHGRSTNSETKLMISNVKPSVSPASTPYGTFDVIVRKYDDTDQRQVILESFVGCTLDPDSPSYVLRKIGDSYEAFDTTQRKFVSYGTWPSKSGYVYVETDTSANPPKEALPWGHSGYTALKFASGSSPQDMKYAPNQKDKSGNVDQNVCWGITFVSGGIEDRMHTYPNNSTLLKTDEAFSLRFLTSSYTAGKRVWTYVPTLAAASQHEPVYASASLYKFNLPFQGGFDGFDLRVKDPLHIANSADTDNVGVVSLKRALDTVANPDAFDMNLIALPGIHNLKVTDHARSLVNERMDALYIMDVTGSTVAEVVGNLKARDLDDNYTATYYPDLKLLDRVNSKILRVSPSVVLLGAIAYSDRVGQVFFAPAGLTRGGLGQFDIVDVVDRLTFQERNDLYDNRINPIASFPSEGVVVFGQKTLQVKQSALDRVNVRRLLIFAKKTVATGAKLLLFEPNNPSTWQRFVNTVNPIFEKIRQDQGIERFKVVMDSNLNTADVVDRNIMKGKIFLQPTKSSEYIDLSFIITNSGVQFGD